MTLPVKPQVCVIDDRVGVFMGSDYKLLPLDVAERVTRQMQSATAALRRKVKRAKRLAARAPR